MHSIDTHTHIASYRASPSIAVGFLWTHKTGRDSFFSLSSQNEARKGVWGGWWLQHRLQTMPSTSMDDVCVCVRVHWLHRRDAVESQTNGWFFASDYIAAFGVRWPSNDVELALNIYLADVMSRCKRVSSVEMLFLHSGILARRSHGEHGESDDVVTTKWKWFPWHVNLRMDLGFYLFSNSDSFRSYGRVWTRVGNQRLSRSATLMYFPPERAFLPGLVDANSIYLFTHGLRTFITTY